MWRGLGVEESSIKSDWSRVDSKDSKGAGLTIIRGIGINRDGIGEIAALQIGMGLRLHQKV